MKNQNSMKNKKRMTKKMIINKEDNENIIELTIIDWTISSSWLAFLGGSKWKRKKQMNTKLVNGKHN